MKAIILALFEITGILRTLTDKVHRWDHEEEKEAVHARISKAHKLLSDEYGRRTVAELNKKKVDTETDDDGTS